MTVGQPALVLQKCKRPVGMKALMAFSLCVNVRGGRTGS